MSTGRIDTGSIYAIWPDGNTITRLADIRMCRLCRARVEGNAMKAMFPTLFEKQCTARYPIGLEVMIGAVYTRWREANPEHTLRFYALRLRKVGMIKSTPQKPIARGTDWRFLNELKKKA
jgi:hypothetical protein